MSYGVIIALILIGVVCLVLELLVLPGGIVGLIGCLMMIGGIVGSFIEYGTMTGSLVLIGTILITVTVVVLMLRAKTWRRLMLHTNIDSRVNEINEDKVQVGGEGVAISRLAPMGKGKFNGEIVEVTSSYGFLDEGTAIIITKIEGNKIFVKLKP